jgi:hypothetical protein
MMRLLPPLLAAEVASQPRKARHEAVIHYVSPVIEMPVNAADVVREVAVVSLGKFLEPKRADVNVAILNLGLDEDRVDLGI